MAGPCVADRDDDPVLELGCAQVQVLVERSSGRVRIDEVEVVQRDRGTGLDDANVDVEKPVRPVGREHLAHAAAHLQRPRGPAERADRGIRVVDLEVDDPALPVADRAIDRDAVDHRVQRGPKSCLRNREGQSRLLALGHVPGGDDVACHPPGGVAQRRGADLEPMRCAVGPGGVDLAARGRACRDGLQQVREAIRPERRHREHLG